MAIFKTFKASIETNLKHPNSKKGEVFFFHPKFRLRQDKVIYNISHEVFEFSKEDILFPKRQKSEYENYLQLHPVTGVGDTFSHGTKYLLNRRSEFGKTIYSIKVGSQEVDLVINWFNRKK